MNKKKQHQANDDLFSNKYVIKQVVYNCDMEINNPFNGEFCREKK